MAARLLIVTVFVVGMASLGAEIAAARLLAPWFGDSTIVWANTIATVLVALSVGYWFGGRLADINASRSGLAKLVLIAALLTAVVPFVARPFLRVSVDALDSVAAGAFVGSLLAVLVLIAAPVLVLGTVTPYALRLSMTGVDTSGRTAGRLYAISTLGSLVGTFLSALVLIPFLGTRRTFLVFALALAVVGAIGLRSKLGALAPVAAIALLAIPVGTIKGSSSGDVVWEAETEYQYARVVQAPDGERTLELNEGEAIHSLYRPGRWLTGNYWDQPLVLPFLAGPAPPRSMAILGNAAGTVARSYGHFFPETRVDAVEIDGELLKAGRDLFDMKGPNLHTHVADARPWLRATQRKFDVIYVDAYRQPYIPFYLATREFFELARDRLQPGGMVMINVGHPRDSPKLEQVLTATMADVFPHVVRDPSEQVNTQLVGSRAPLRASTLRAAQPDLPPELRPVAARTADLLGPPLRGGKVYTDDVAPVEWLIDASILKVAAEGER